MLGIMELEQPLGQCCERKIGWQQCARHNIRVIKFTIDWDCTLMYKYK